MPRSCGFRNCDNFRTTLPEKNERLLHAGAAAIVSSSRALLADAPQGHNEAVGTGDSVTVIEQTSRLLWEACQRDPDPTDIRRALDGGADVELGVAAAVPHRIGPLLWRALGAAGARDVVGPETAVLGAMVDALRMEAVLLVPRAVALAVGPLTEAGLEPVVFKGPAVAAVYPEPGLRPMDDIDLLLPADRHALQVLQRAGWRVVREAGRHHYDTVLLHDEVPSFSLEVHYGLEEPSRRVTSLDPGALWSRRVPVRCAGTGAFGLSPVDELVVLAAHAGKPFHGFTRLLWIADLAMKIDHPAAPPVDWDAVRARAEEANCLTVVGAALALARYAGVEAPPELFPLPTRGWRGRALRQLLSVTWPLTAHELHRYRLTYALTDAPALRLRALVVVLGNWHGIGVRLQAKTRHPFSPTRDHAVTAGAVKTPHVPPI
jgi:Uncharacterised nucleotidyltransferase